VPADSSQVETGHRLTQKQVEENIEEAELNVKLNCVGILQICNVRNEKCTFSSR
jgi:hypothetical protein